MWGTEPIFLIIGLFIGLAAGIYSMLVSIRNFYSGDKQPCQNFKPCFNDSEMDVFFIVHMCLAGASLTAINLSWVDSWDMLESFNLWLWLEKWTTLDKRQQKEEKSVHLDLFHRMATAGIGDCHHIEVS